MDIINFIKNLGKQEVAIFKNAKEMMLWHYINFLETNDIRWFSNYFELKKPKSINQEKLETAFTDIYNEVFEISGNTTYQEKISTHQQILKYQTKHDAVKRLIWAIRNHDLRMENGKEILDQLIDALEKWKFKLNRSEPLFEQLNVIDVTIESLITEIEALKIELKKGDTDEKTDIEDMILFVEDGLEMKFAIDVKTTSVDKWLRMQKKLKQKIERIERVNNRNKTK